MIFAFFSCDTNGNERVNLILGSCYLKRIYMCLRDVERCET